MNTFIYAVIDLSIYVHLFLEMDIIMCIASRLKNASAHPYALMYAHKYCIMIHIMSLCTEVKLPVFILVNEVRFALSLLKQISSLLKNEHKTENKKENKPKQIKPTE